MPKQKVTVQIKNSEDTLSSDWISVFAKVSEEAACSVLLEGPAMECWGSAEDTLVPFWNFLPDAVRSTTAE